MKMIKSKDEFLDSVYKKYEEALVHEKQQNQINQKPIEEDSAPIKAVYGGKDDMKDENDVYSYEEYVEHEEIKIDEEKGEEEEKKVRTDVAKRNRLFKQLATAAACLVVGVGILSATGTFRMGASSADMAAYTTEAPTEAYYGTGAMNSTADMKMSSKAMARGFDSDDSADYDEYNPGVADMVVESAEEEMADGESINLYDIPADTELKDGEAVSDPNKEYKTSQKDEKKELKLVYRANMTVQTTEFDKTVDALLKMVDEYEGYIESQDTYNGGYFESGAYKSCYFTFRVPQENYRRMLDKMGSSYHVSYLNESVEDIGQAYYDTESHIKTLQIKEERLHELLKQATKMSDIIDIESALTDTEHELESYQSTLKNYDSLVNYSTISVSVEKVTQYADGVTHDISFWERIGRAFKNGAIGFVEGLENFLVWIGYNIFTLAVILVIIFLIVRWDIIGRIIEFFKGIRSKGKENTGKRKLKAKDRRKKKNEETGESQNK